MNIFLTTNLLMFAFKKDLISIIKFIRLRYQLDSKNKNNYDLIKYLLLKENNEKIYLKNIRITKTLSNEESIPSYSKLSDYYHNCNKKPL